MNCVECLDRKKTVPALAGRLWCVACAPENWVVQPGCGRHGYYIASARKRFGDPELADSAMVAWRALHRRSRTKYCGVSVIEDGGRIWVLVTTLKDGAVKPTTQDFR